MQIGIVGAPNQGKSTFFNAATLAGAETADYPFTTVKSNQGVGHVRVECVCKEFGVQCNPRHGWCADGKRFVPVTLLDVAGLVPDAHTGRGLGNQFLNDLSQAAALIHVVDASGKTNESGEKVEGYDPSNAIRFLEREVDLWYAGILEKNWDKFSRRVKMEKGDLSEQISRQFAGLGVNQLQVIEAMEAYDFPEDPTAWSKEQLIEFATRLREIAKRMLIVANKIDVEGAWENYKRMVKEFPQYIIIPASSEIELALRRASKSGLLEYTPGDPEFTVSSTSSLNEKQRRGIELMQEFLKKYKTTGVQEALDKAVFDLLGYIAVFPGGVGRLMDSEGRVLPDVFLLPPNSTVLDFAYTIHSDFGNNFITAIDVRTKMKLGKDHKLRNRDVIELVSGK